MLPAKLATLTSVPNRRILGTDFPHIAALSYALASLVLRPYEKPIKYHETASYRPLDPGVGM